ncbi:MAG: AAA family ATPase [Desulfococcaceae bacterium]
MIIRRIRLENWKNFREAEALLEDRTFLIGPNGAGKSNFLDAVRFFRDVARDGLRKAVVEKRSSVNALRCFSAPKNEEILLECDLIAAGSRWRYALVFGEGNQNIPGVKRETVHHEEQLVLERPNSEDKADPLRLTQTALEQIAANAGFRPVADGFQSIAYQHLLPQVVRDPRAFTPYPVHDDPFGRDLLDRMWETHPQTRKSRLRKIVAVLQSAVPQLQGLVLAVDPSTKPHLIGRFTKGNGATVDRDESQFSDGTLRLVGLLWSILEGDGPLLLEEPEISLHPEVVRQLPSLLFQINRERKHPRQLILSTHSHELLSDIGIQPEEVLRLIPGEEGTRIVSPGDADREAMRAGLTAADVFMPQAAPEGVSGLLLSFGK